MRKNNILIKLFTYLITAYQYLISPVLPHSCRYSPTCSEYTRQAILKYGALKGSWLGIKRILRCNPFHIGGYDPIPDLENK